LFFEEPVFEGSEPRLKLETTTSGVTILVPFLPPGLGEKEIIAAQRRLLDEFLGAQDFASLTLWYYTPVSLAFTRHLECDLCVYDNMDELTAFRGAPPQLLALEEELFSRADLVFTGGQSLYEAKKSRHSQVFAFPSSIDVGHFARARVKDQKDPSDQSHLPHPRLGFFGVIDERMDTDLLRSIAEMRPDWQFVLIGPVVKIDPATLPQGSNIHWLGSKSYEELPLYLAHWDVAIMPFALNEATRYISPTKTPEFLAGGIPVVSTAITDVIRPYGELGIVEIASGPEEFVEKAANALAFGLQSRLDRVDRMLAANSWDRTWNRMFQLIQTTAHGRAPVASIPFRHEVRHV
jgi:glycosyltransferase involved in cell wall biosynthesis